MNNTYLINLIDNKKTITAKVDNNNKQPIINLIPEKNSIIHSLGKKNSFHDISINHSLFPQKKKKTTNNHNTPFSCPWLELHALETATDSQSLLTWFRKRIIQSPLIAANDFQQFLLAYDDLANCPDELTQLILENCALDALIHGLTIKFVPPKTSSLNDDNILYGRFQTSDHSVNVYNYPQKKSTLVNTLLHELTHAICYFIFSKHNSFPNDFASFMEQLKLDGLPCPRSHNEKMNPAYFKFRRCVKEDMAHHKTFSLLYFFPSIERSYQEGARLGEIFSFYMEQRLTIFKAFREDSLKKIELLFPRLHAYFETDIKKILKLRLKSHTETLKKYHLQSNFAKSSEKTAIHADYQEGGTLKFKRG